MRGKPPLVNAFRMSSIFIFSLSKTTVTVSRPMSNSDESTPFILLGMAPASEAVDIQVMPETLNLTFFSSAETPDVKSDRTSSAVTRPHTTPLKVVIS